MKKLINDANQVVSEMIEGLIASSPGLMRLSGHNVLLRSDIDAVRDSKVAIVSGGGSGHEPAHAGYIGAGMLTAAVLGEVFTSPSVGSVYAAIKAVAGPPGVLLIVKNYTGDRLNFGLAAEMVLTEGIRVEMIIVADDVALAASEGSAGPRGIAGTVLVHKIAGASANEGKPLSEVAQIGREAAESVATMGLSLSSGIIPAVGKPNFVIGENQIELGLGIHGEPGVERLTLEPADALVDRVLRTILVLSRFRSGSSIVLLVNNLGATTPMEIAIVSRRAVSVLESQGFLVERVYTGAFMTSLETAGISLSVLPVTPDRLRYLDAETTAPAWPRTLPLRSKHLTYNLAPEAKQNPSHTSESRAPRPALSQKLEQAIKAACAALIEAEPTLTRMDQAVGDGDLGHNLARGSRSVQTLLPSYPLENPSAALRELGLALQESLGGSSGPLYGVFFLRAGIALQNRGWSDRHGWAEAFAAGCQAISELGGAQAGDRTMLDALLPFSETFSKRLEQNAPLSQALKQALEAGKQGALQTAQMTPKRGRSSYLGKRSLGFPDPGAMAVTIWLEAVIQRIAQ